MNNLYYTRITIPSDTDPSNETPDVTVMNQVFTRIHRCANGAKFALSLPGLSLSCDEGKSTVGNTVQIFCSAKADLQKIMENPKLQRLLRDYCEVTPIRPVLPNMIVGWESYVRDRVLDKLGPSALRRAQRRIDAGKCTENRASRKVRSSDPTDACDLPYFEHLSLTTASIEGEARNFRIFVRRVANTKPSGFGFDSFGLARQRTSSPSKFDGAVPVLKTTSRD